MPAEQITRQIARGCAMAVVVTYHPDAGIVERLRRIGRQFSRLIIVDNCSDDHVLAALRSLVECEPTFALIENDENLGVGAALNQGCRWAAEHGAGWIATFDQDSSPAPDFLVAVERELTAAATAQTIRRSVGLIGVNYRRPTGDTLAPEGIGLVDAAAVITSGSLLSVAAWRAVGEFRADFFIDEIDHEYAFRLRKAGWSVVRTRRVLMEHALGATQTHRLAATARWTLSHHSALRRYYMIRNRVLLAREYLTVDLKYFYRRFLETLGEVAGVILFEADKLAKLRAMGAGLFDGLRGRTGRAD